MEMVEEPFGPMGLTLNVGVTPTGNPVNERVMFLLYVPAAVAVTTKDATDPLSTTRAVGATTKKKSGATRTSSENVTFFEIAIVSSTIILKLDSL
jgi:hypothetical protein